MDLELFKHIVYQAFKFIVSGTVFVTFLFCLLKYIYIYIFFSIEINQNVFDSFKSY